MIMSSRVLGQRLSTSRVIQHRNIMVPATSSEGIRPSATLIVAAPYAANKQGASDYRILMMKRNAKSSFINAHVFPGGVVDKHDNASLWQSILGFNNTKAHEVTHKICAIRETFEESGLLLTHPPAHTVLLDSVSEEWRLKIQADASQFKVLCETFKLTPAIDKLLPFANWITPEAEKRRYNTQFFLTTLDDASVTKRIEGEAALAADGKETVQLDWFTPEQALNASKEKKIVLFPPQWYTLHTLHQAGAFARLGQAGIGALRRRDGSVSTVMPQMGTTPEDDPVAKEGFHAYLAYPGDETYLDIVTGQPTGTKGQRHRIYFKGRMESYRLEKNVDVSDIEISKKANL